MVTNLKYNLGVAYDYEIKKKFGHKPDLYSYFKNHPRRELLINNIHDEVKKQEFTGKPFKPEQIAYIAHEFMNQFMQISIKHAEQQAMTELQRSMIQKEQTPEELETELLERGFIEKVEDERTGEV